MRANLLKLSLSASLLFALTGCVSTRFDDLFDGQKSAATYDEAGSAQIAVLSVTKWDDAKADMQPKFTLDEAGALTAVLPVTSASEDKLYQAAALGLRVAGPTTTFSNTDSGESSSSAGTSADTKTTIVTNADGTTVTTGTGTNGTTGSTLDSSDSKTTTTKASGDASKLTVTQGDKGDLKPTATAPALGTDPMLQYQTAAALYQDVKMLNRYVTDAVVGEGASAYVVHLKVSVSPKMHNLPYDAYTEISFLPSDIEHTETCPGTVEIEPLFATENLEALQSSRSREAAQQMALALTAMIGAYGTAGDASRVDHRLHDILGRDYNSTLNVSRLSASTALVRFGAVQNTLSNYAMMNKENRVTLLVIYRPYKGTRTDCPQPTASERLTVVSRTDFVDTNTGKKVPVKDDVQRVGLEYGRLAKQYRLHPEITVPQTSPLQYPAAGTWQTSEYLYHLAMSATQNDYAQFRDGAKYLWPKQEEHFIPRDCKKTSRDPVPCGLTPLEIELYTSALWVDMLHINAGNQFSYDHMDISLAGKPAWPVLPEDQPVFMTNDDSGANAVLLRGTALKVEMLRATLVGISKKEETVSKKVRVKKGQFKTVKVKQTITTPHAIAATAIEIRTSGDVAVTFPDVALAQIDTTLPATLTVDMPAPDAAKYASLKSAPRNTCQGHASVNLTACMFPVTFVTKPKKEPAAPAYAISLPSSAIVATGSSGSLQIVIDATASKDATPLFLKVSEGEYAGCAAIGGMTVPLKEEAAKLAIAKAGSCRLSLVNLRSGVPVSISLVDKDGKIYGAAVVAGVVAAAAAPAKTGG